MTTLSFWLAFYLLLVAPVCHGWVSPFFRTTTTQSRLQASTSEDTPSAATPPSPPTGFNVVLTPSTDEPSAFDSLQIGHARVHRYAAGMGGSGEEETQYVMWYHGRSANDADANAVLPPLSTGRIGRALSRNGLIWRKDRKGSASEDVADCSLGKNKESWWSFDTTHVGLGNVLMPMSTPAVIAEGGIYLMYYMGGSGDETALADYMNDDSLPEAVKEQKVQGMRMKIGVAVSQDGNTWGRVEGDDPTGACMVPYDKADPHACQDAPADMPDELYTAWPEVVVDVNAPEGEDAFRMYYSSMLKDDKTKCIGLATSPDGFRWIKQGIVLRPDEEGPDSKGCARCCVVRDAVYDEDIEEWEESKTWKMYYDGASEDGKHRVLVAESEDGTTWTKTGVALEIGDDGAWDHGGVSSPYIVRMDDGSERMYYTGLGADGSTAIGVAKLDGTKTFIREQATFTFAL